MKNTSDLFNKIIPLGRLIYTVNQKKNRLLDDHLPPLSITTPQSKALRSIYYVVCITPVESRKVLSVNLGALTQVLDKLACKDWVGRLSNPHDKHDVLAKLIEHGAAICERYHQLAGQDLHQKLTENLTAGEVATLKHLLRRVLS